MSNFVESANDSIAFGDEALVDANGNVWSITNGQVTETTNPNSTSQVVTVDTLTGNVDALAWVNGLMWQQATPSWSSTPLWWAKTGTGYDGWGIETASNPLPVSPDGTIVGPDGDTNAIVDPSGNLWSLSDGQVVENGVTDTGTNGVIEIAYKGGVVWQEAIPSWSTTPLWWAKTGGPGSYDGWTSGPGTDNANGNVTAPVAVTRAYVGGDDQASNPADWSPASLPAPGDTLTMTPGLTMNVAGDVLRGDTVSLIGNPAETQLPDVINLSGNVQMSTGSGGTNFGPLTMNLSAGAAWIGGMFAGPYGGGVTIQGAGEWSNTSSRIDNSVVVGVDVVGDGTIAVSGAHYDPVVEFMHGVSAGQSISINSYASYGNDSFVSVDDPSTFHASVALGFGELNLKGLVATSYDIKGDLLTLLNGSNVVDTLNLTVEPDGAVPGDFGVSQVGSMISIHADGNHSQGVLLPTS